MKVIWSGGTDGSRTFAGWHDSQLDVDCAFGAASDGNFRCLPYAVSADVYADANCTQPVVEAACAPGTKYAYVRTRATAACGGLDRDQLYNLGSAMSVTKVFQKGFQTCVAEDVPQGYQVYALGDAIPSETFVERAITVGP